LSHLDHSKWESFSEDTGKRRRHRWVIMESNKRNLVSMVQLLTLYTNCRFMTNIVQPEDFSFSFQIFMLEVRAEWMTEKRIFLVAAVWDYLRLLILFMHFYIPIPEHQ
jgi:hypothetical protein